MCGIAIQYLDKTCHEDKISHRGLIKHQAEFGPYMMTHFKLPFQTDLEDEFDQPIKLKNGNYLLFNGEIFNHPPEYKNDVDYLVDFFSDPYWESKIGGKEYNTWDGFWAICIVSGSGIVAFTDPLGKKQLYYKDGCIASEMKVLMDDNKKNMEFDDYEVMRGDITPFEGIKRIVPNKSHFFIETDIKIYSLELFDLRREPVSCNLVGLMEQSVASRMINRLDTNTLFVSGGLDSTIILYHIHKLGLMDKFQLLTIENKNDMKYVSLLESYFSCQVERIDQNGLWQSEKESIIRHYEYPIEKGSLFQQYRLCNKSKGSVLYSGDGADELFSGYSRAQLSDTKEFDIFTELPYYHNIRLDRIGMMFTKEIRSPFMGHEVIRYALNTPYSLRKGKRILKFAYRGLIPEEILLRSKEPLREKSMVRNREKYQEGIVNKFNSIKFNK